MRFLLFPTCFILFSNCLWAQQLNSDPLIHKIPQEVLAGEGLDSIPQKDPSRTVFQKRVFSGKDLDIYMVAIGTGITNEFKSFPMEEFIFWMNGKAVVEPVGAEPFEVQSGDYFIQAKGFEGKWNFIDNGGLHLELALVAKNRPDASIKSSITQAIVLNRDLISGVIPFENEKQIYEGPELTVNLLKSNQIEFDNNSQECMLHVLSGVLLYESTQDEPQYYYPGDFIIIEKEFKGILRSNSLQQLRIIEVFKTKS